MPKAGKIVLAVVAVVAVGFCVGSYAIDRHVLGQTYARYTSDTPRLMLTDGDIAADYPSDEVEFRMDGGTLRGHVYGAGNTRGLIVFRHGIFSQHQDYLALVTALVDKGWKVFAYDAIGCGESDGDNVIGFAQSPLDIRAAVQFAFDSGMHEIAGAEGARSGAAGEGAAATMPVVLFGHSWGGYGVAGALDFPDVRDRVAACVSMSGFDTPDDIILESAAGVAGPLAATQKPFIDLIGYLDFGTDGSRSAARAIGACEVPTLVIHGTGDAVISFEGASIYAERGNMANPNVEFIVKDEPGRDGHNTYFYAPESQSYLDECGEQLADLLEQHGGSIPADQLSAFMATVDKRRANTADPQLIDQIDDFLARATSR